MGLIEQIQAWYAAQCDGDWEHQYGISIETLDNPGWCVTVDLFGTSLENGSFQTYQEDKSEEDWVVCEISGNKFVGRGDPGKLQTILEIFVSLIERQP
jgi:Immunity protein 53